MILLFSIVNRQLVEQLDIHIDCFPYLHQADIFVGCMGTGGVSRSDLYGREVHEGLVAQSRRTERLFSHHDGTAYERMLQICTGGVEAEAAGFYFAADLRFDQFEQFFVGIEFVCPDIDGEFAAVRNDIVLCPGMDNRDAHLYRSEEIAFPGN